MDDTQNSFGFHKDQAMIICKGCRDFRDRLFDPKPLQEGHIAIHKNFTELSNCANTSCDLCKYIRREFCYYSSNYETYSFNSEDLQDVHNDVNVNLFLSDRETPEDHTKIENRLWQFFLGQRPGPSHFRAHNNWVKDRSLNQQHILGGDLGLDRLLLLSRQWLTTCIAEHKNCGPQAGDEPAFLPTRLLDVGQPGQRSIQLVLSEDLPKSKKNEYATLSYCWGEANNAACTTMENLVVRLTGIPTASLPKTLRDAIEITRALRVRYLWIDALCIIQVKDGVNEDWQREFPTMGKVYRHSLLTIAASGAKDSSVGCFYRRPESRWPVQNYFLLDENRARGPDNPVILEAILPNWNVAVEHSELAKRGWVLQERMLASRTLFWTGDGLFWGCSELNASECEAKLLYSNRTFPVLHELVESVKGHVHNSRYEQTAWTNVLEEFSQKTLTVVTDKLPAVAGVGGELSSLTGQEFKTGVWRHNLVQELAWVADFYVLDKDDAAVDPQADRLPKTPSWSWASINQKVHFKPGRHGWECEELAIVDFVSAPSVSIDAQQLRVRGRLGELRIRKLRTRIALSNRLVYPPTRCTFEPLGAEQDEDFHNTKKEVAVLDTLADTLPEEGGTIWCLQWMKWEDHLRHSNIENETRYSMVTGALIVSQVDKEGKIYRRIGWLEVVDDDFVKWENETIILV